jgi:hypothetical protein
MNLNILCHPPYQPYPRQFDFRLFLSSHPVRPLPRVPHRRRGLPPELDKSKTTTLPAGGEDAKISTIDDDLAEDKVRITAVDDGVWTGYDPPIAIIPPLNVVR